MLNFSDHLNKSCSNVENIEIAKLALNRTLPKRREPHGKCPRLNQALSRETPVCKMNGR